MTEIIFKGPLIRLQELRTLFSPFTVSSQDAVITIFIFSPKGKNGVYNAIYHPGVTFEFFDPSQVNFKKMYFRTPFLKEVLNELKSHKQLKCT